MRYHIFSKTKCMHANVGHSVLFKILYVIAYFPCAFAAVFVVVQCIVKLYFVQWSILQNFAPYKVTFIRAAIYITTKAAAAAKAEK